LTFDDPEAVARGLTDDVRVAVPLHPSSTGRSETIGPQIPEALPYPILSGMSI